MLSLNVISLWPQGSQLGNTADCFSPMVVDMKFPSILETSQLRTKLPSHYQFDFSTSYDSTI